METPPERYGVQFNHFPVTKSSPFLIFFFSSGITCKAGKKTISLGYVGQIVPWINRHERLTSLDLIMCEIISEII